MILLPYGKVHGRVALKQIHKAGASKRAITNRHACGAVRVPGLKQLNLSEIEPLWKPRRNAFDPTRDAFHLLHDLLVISVPVISRQHFIGAFAGQQHGHILLGSLAEHV